MGRSFGDRRRATGRNALRFELRGFGIDEIVIEPGAIETERGARSGPRVRRVLARAAVRTQFPTPS
jgi:hypothetical protein